MWKVRISQELWGQLQEGKRIEVFAGEGLLILQLTTFPWPYADQLPPVEVTWLDEKEAGKGLRL